MELIKPGSKINFTGVKHYAILGSIILIVLSLFGMGVWPGINWGIDFAGGATIQVAFKKSVDMNQLRKAIESLDLGEVMVQRSDLIGAKAGDNYMIKVEKLGIEDKEMSTTSPDPVIPATTPEPKTEPPKPETGATAELAPQPGNTTDPAPGNTATPAPGNTATPAPTMGNTADATPPAVAPPVAPHEPTPIEKKLDEVFGKDSYEILSTDFVGPRVGKELRNRGFMAVVLALVLLLVYVTLRFDVRFAVGAIIALFHDVTITMGAFVLTDREFNLAIIAALLSIVGYSLNDTIVVCDRIRDNIRRMKRVSFEEMINTSINETLSRTIMTSFLTFLAVFFLWLLGGGVINDFAFAMMVGIIVGTYSSIFIASPVVIYWENYRASKRSPALEAKK